MEDKLLFSPGPVPLEQIVRMEYSHRSAQFETLYKNCQERLEELTGRKILFVQGSASAAIETVLHYLLGTSVGTRGEGNMWSHSGGIFARRAAEVAVGIGGKVFDSDKIRIMTPWYAIGYAVQFETSESKVYDLREFCGKCAQDGAVSVVDAVSSFPYYSLPDADIIILSSAKQLRGLPVLGIIACKKELAWNFSSGEPPRSEYLSIQKIVEYDKRNQTPHTPMVPQFQSLWSSLRFRLWQLGVEAVEKNAKAVTYNLIDNVIGERVAPVITFKVKQLEPLKEYLEKLGLEVYYNSSYMGKQFQVSTFNYKDTMPYKRLQRALEHCKKEGWL